MVRNMVRSGVACLMLAACCNSVARADDEPRFEKRELSKAYFSEGANVGDINRDGNPDVVSGPNWYEGPDMTPHMFYDGNAFPNDRGYSDNFFSFIGDFNDDEWLDVLVVGLPGTPANWYENPGETEPRVWKKHLAFPAVDNEAPMYGDLTGDGVNELICTYQGRLGYAAPRKGAPEREWEFHPISEKGPWQRFSHGLGIGDINGDDRPDFLMPEGWWEHPEDAATDLVWKHHPHRFAAGGAQLYAADVDGDGDNDVVTSLQAHAWGLSWFEQVRADDGSIDFREHKVMGATPEENPFGVAFSQLHAIECIDVNNDQRPDIVAGKCYWAHNGGDPGARDPAVVYWFENTVEDGKVVFVPHQIDDDSGVGRQIRVFDVDKDGLPDIVTSNKKGAYFFRQLAE